MSVKYHLRTSGADCALLQVCKTSRINGASNGSIRATLQAIITQHGFRGLFQGVHLNYIKVVPATAVGFATYDCVKDAFDPDNSA